MGLRGYQHKLVSTVSGFYKQDLKAVLMQSATGSGKTRTATFIVQKYANTNRQVLWLVHREELLMQAALTFSENGIKHRLICSASSERAIKAQQFRELGRSFVDNSAVVVVASIQTIIRRLDKLPWLKPAQIIADECHLSLAETWRRTLGTWPESRLLGLTATPCRLDKQSFAKKDGGLYEDIAVGLPPHELVKIGHLAPYKIYAPPVHLVEGIKIGTKGNDHNPEDLAKELDSNVVYGDVIAHYKKYSLGLPAIGFCPTVAISQKYSQAFCDAGFKAISLDGQTDDAIRRESLQQLGRGEIDVIMSVSILIEGTDVPYATTAIWLRKTKSLAMWLQGTGRVRRTHPNKPFAIILDCVGTAYEHGLPDEEREWNLSGEPRKKKADNDNEPDVKTMTCKECFAIHAPMPVCPCCGNVYVAKERKEAKQIDVDIVDAAEAIEAARRAKRQQQGQAQTVEELQAQGMSFGQASRLVQARAEKQTLIENVIDLLEAHKQATGQTALRAFDVTYSEVRKMKPKPLKELREMILTRTAEMTGRQQIA